jgi:hypothetical protein
MADHVDRELAKAKNLQLVLIGAAINKLIREVKAAYDDTPISAEMLSEFADYVRIQESVGFVFDPTAYRDALYRGDFEKAQARVQFLRPWFDGDPIITVPEAAGDWRRVKGHVIGFETNPTILIVRSLYTGYEYRCSWDELEAVNE